MIVNPGTIVSTNMLIFTILLKYNTIELAKKKEKNETLLMKIYLMQVFIPIQMLVCIVGGSYNICLNTETKKI